MTKLSAKFKHFWDEDKSLTVMMLLLALFVFVFIPLISQGRSGEIIIKLVYTVILLTGILSVAKSKRSVIIVSALAIIGVITNWLSEIDPSRPAIIVNDFGAILYILYFAWAMLVKTFKPGEVTYHRIQGSIVVYLLMGLIFAYIFHVIFLFAGAGSFNNISGPGLKEFVYFSFTSLTTMGYGDVTPVHPLARSLANLEALIGQLYPAILIARLVSMEFESSHNKKEKNELPSKSEKNNF